MTSDIKRLLEGLDRKELLEIANLKRINIPHSWSKQLMVELLSLNVSIDDVNKRKMKPLKSRRISGGAPIIVVKDLFKKFEDVTAVDNLNLEIGEGELFKLKFMVAKNANLQDLMLPVIWEFDYDFDLRAPAFSSASGESLYVDVDWPGELTGPNYDIFPIVTFVNGGVKVCSDAFCWTGDLNLNEYPYEIADVVLYANYFIYGPEVFDINYDLQLLASDVNKDGFYPSIADFVFLIRIIMEDISPKHSWPRQQI